MKVQLLDKMSITKNKKISDFSLSITIAPIAIVMLIFLSACGGGKKKFANAITERDSLPIMKSVEVETLVSDSGVTRYKVITPLWEIYDKKKPSYWSFEKGVYLEKFDTLFNVEASIKADTAYYYDKKKLWKLIGNVFIKNIKGQKFYTELLYWDQDKEKVYSDKKVRIEEKDKISIGRGFESNQQMTNFVIKNTEGIFYVDAADETQKTDSTKRDSIATKGDSVKAQK